MCYFSIYAVDIFVTQTGNALVIYFMICGCQLVLFAHTDNACCQYFWIRAPKRWRNSSITSEYVVDIVYISVYLCNFSLHKLLCLTSLQHLLFVHCHSVLFINRLLLKSHMSIILMSVALSLESTSWHTPSLPRSARISSPFYRHHSHQILVFHFRFKTHFFTNPFLHKLLLHLDCFHRLGLWLNFVCWSFLFFFTPSC